MSGLTGATLSNLSSTSYGFDFVVGATQLGINNALQQYLSGPNFPVVSVCHMADAQGNSVLTGCDQVTQAAGVDPFSLGNVTLYADTNPQVQALLDARFVSGFKAVAGVPAAADPSSLPDIVVLGTDTSSVLFNMLCSEFTIVGWSAASGLFSPAQIQSMVQDPSDPWIFQSKVNMQLDDVDQGGYSNLSAPVQAQIANMGGQAFSVQQLYFDLVTPGLETVPTITNLDPGTDAYSLLTEQFLGTYFNALETYGEPILGVAVVPQTASASTLELTDFDFQVSPYVGSDGNALTDPSPLEESLATLNYLCAADGDTLPKATSFAWNWVDESQIVAGSTTNPDGAVAINRNALAGYFESELTDFATRCSILPHVTVTYSDLELTYAWQLSSLQTPTITHASETKGETVLVFNYAESSSDQAGVNGALGKMTLSTNYTMTVTFAGTDITIWQNMVVYLYVDNESTSGSGNIIDKTITDTYALSIGSGGRLQASHTNSTVDNSYEPSVNKALNFFTQLNNIISDIDNSVTSFVSIFLNNIPISVVQEFVFPGGNTFNYLDVVFSENQDLVSSIQYQYASL